ncbi:hypothetical protein CASFOL_018880 [Castilleja foliolosa]|uniref:WRKY domain-containing protein n=1 Tax=Castilleja foliolosa TaxID=1961234 RepID=A0ABD3D6G5_9LAMI
MGETIGDAPPASKAKPTILVPPRGLLFSNGSGPGFSPGPMSSNLFPEQGPFSFSQLLAGAMSSPLAAAAQPHPESFSPLFMVPPGLNLTGFNSPGYLSPLQSPFGMSHQQALAHVTAQAALTQSFKQMQAEFHHSSSNHPSLANHSPDTLTQNLTTNSLPSEPESSKADPISEIPQSDKIPGDKPANDGYNWRKYGQKKVKASECPRSYYKCSSLNCPVKKKVERALDGRVSEVTYKGEHNHDLPENKKRGKDSCASDTTNMASQGQIEADGLKEAINSDNNDKDSAIIVDKGDEDEPSAKKRSLDIGPSMPVSSHQAVSDPKIVLQTRSEVDLLDDGYKWRKYGQKLVKGNLHPRSYYRCTYTGCNVRKHVERASVDPKAVITTYEGKHNHDLPTGIHTGAQQLKTQNKMVSKNHSVNEEIDYREDNDNNIPISLQLKEG